MTTITAPAGSDWMTDERKAFVEASGEYAVAAAEHESSAAP